MDYNIPTLRKPSPASWVLWGPVWPITWSLPQSLVNWQRQPAEARLKSLKDGLRDTLNEVFSENGKYALSFFNYPHRQTTSTNFPELHCHGAVSVVRLDSKLKSKRQRCNKSGDWESLSELDIWRKLSKEEQVKELPKLLTAPPITMSEQNRYNLNLVYKEHLKDIFGEKTLRGDNDLVWIGPAPIIAVDERKNYALYLKNNPTSILNKISASFNETDDAVVVQPKKNQHFYDFDLDENRSYTYNFYDFVHKFILRPLLPFYGIRFMGIGGFHGSNHFKKIFQCLSSNPEILEQYYPELSTLEKASQDSLAQGYLDLEIVNE